MNQSNKSEVVTSLRIEKEKIGAEIEELTRETVCVLSPEVKIVFSRKVGLFITLADIPQLSIPTTGRSVVGVEDDIKKLEQAIKRRKEVLRIMKDASPTLDKANTQYNKLIARLNEIRV